MEYGSGVGLRQKLALERKLLEEEKFVVRNLKKVRMEHHAVQVTRMHMTSLLIQEMKNADEQMKQDQLITSQQAAQDTAQIALLDEELNLNFLDDEPRNEMDLNLTVPQHPFHGMELDEELEEFVNIDDYEIEMNMLMNGRNSNKTY